MYIKNTELELIYEENERRLGEGVQKCMGRFCLSLYPSFS